MLNHFLENIKEKNLLNTGGKVLLAVSGGIDSMVMLYLFEKSGFDYGIVHCNFQLRGAESDRDEEFVKTQVLIHGVPAFFKRFDTEEYAQINGISIEMAARELRYEYFEKIRAENGYDCIATAHHSDDLIETFFLNLTRKTGIKGLTGIKDKSGKIIRPMLFASRADIEKFASEQYLEFREDSTNSEVVYQRNFLRHKILPLFSSLNSSFKKNLLASIENLKDAEAVYSGFFETEKQKVVEKATDSPFDFAQGDILFKVGVVVDVFSDDGEHEVFGGGGVCCAFEADKSAWFHVTANVGARGFDVTHVGFAEFVEGRGYTDDECIALFHPGEVGGGFERDFIHHFSKHCIADVFDVVFTRIDFIYFGFRLVEPDNFYACFGEVYC